jgi:hypothetical protein
VIARLRHALRPRRPKNMALLLGSLLLGIFVVLAIFAPLIEP